MAELPDYSEKKIPTLCTSRLLRSRLNRLAERAVRLLSIEKLGPAGLSAGAPEKARGFGRRRDHGVGELARPWGGQHIENSCSRFDVLRKPILRARKKDVVMIETCPDVRIIAEKYHSLFPTTLAEFVRQREGESEWRGVSHLKKGSRCSTC